MPCQSDDEESQLPSDSDYATLQTDRIKCWAECDPFSGEGSSSICPPVKKIKFEIQGRAQEQSAQCEPHVTLIVHCPAL